LHTLNNEKNNLELYLIILKDRVNFLELNYIAQ